MIKTNLFSKKNILLFASTVVLSATVFAKDHKRPDLTGIWTNVSMTGLTRPAGIKKLVLTEQEAKRIADGLPIGGIARELIDADDFTDPDAGAPEKGGSDFGTRGYNAFWVDPGTQLAKVKGEFRSSYIVSPENGQIPRRPDPNAGRANYGRYVTGVGGNSDPEALPIAERCLIGFGNTGGPGMTSVLYNNTYQFVQTDDHVMILVEMAHDARIIPTFDSEKKARASHKPNVIKPWLGDSVGWYENETLVVETINVNPLQSSQSTIRISDNGRVIERFQRYSDSEIFYSFTVEDDSLYTQPWTAELSFHTSPGQVYEYACHEGNYSMEGILAGARLKEREAQKK